MLERAEPQDLIMYRSHVSHLFHVPTMMCEWCVGRLTDVLHAIDRSAQIEADLKVQTLKVQSNCYEAALLRILREIGYPAKPILPPLG
jgi:copper chaperone CopZ